MLGSPTHLHSVGTSAYAADWVDALARLEARWEGVHVCPLVPIIRENYPTSLARELLELAYWLASVYSGTTRGLGDAWLHVVSWLSRAIDNNPDNVVIFYTIQLPSSLAKGCRHMAHTFQSSGLSPTSLPGICLRATDELVHVLVSNLNRDFHTDINPQSLLRDPIEAPHIKDTSKSVVLLGGSNLSNTAPYITALGYKVWDLSQRGLVLLGGCIDSLIATITASDIPCDAAVILDLFGNSVYRWRQEDGTMALPVKSRNGYHLHGPVGVCEDATFKKLIETSLPLFEHFNKHRKVVIPPPAAFPLQGVLL
jgi:hypothetical protein